METRDLSATSLNAHRDNARRESHDEVLTWALERARWLEWEEIKVDLSHLYADGLPRPDPTGEGGLGHVPDLTGYKGGELRVVEVKGPGAFEFAGTKTQLEALSAYAKREGGRLTLFVPQDAEVEARAFLDLNPVDLDLHVSDREYRHEMNLDYPDYGSQG